MTKLFRLDAASGVPFYRQIIEQVLLAVADGRLKPGSQLPTVRQLAVDLSINLNTVSKAYRAEQTAVPPSVGGLWKGWWTGSSRWRRPAGFLWTSWRRPWWNGRRSPPRSRTGVPDRRIERWFP
jgi:DNA-binding transcriptional MocR family regulator